MYQIDASRPSSGNKFFNTKSNGGYSSCIQGKPVISGLNVLCNCVGGASAKFNEIYSKITGYQGMKYPYLNCNAENFISRANAYYPDIKVVQEPVEGGIMVWEGIGSLAGHVAFVGKCNSATQVYTGESGYNSFAWANYTRNKGFNGNWGLNTTNYKYLGCLVNPAVGEQRSYQSSTPTSEISDKSVDELAREVIAGKYGNGDARRNALGSRYSEVQARVNQILAENNISSSSASSSSSNSSNILELVKKTIRGDFGNGQVRRNVLGSNYDEVQKQVNLNIKNGTTRWDNIKLY